MGCQINSLRTDEARLLDLALLSQGRCEQRQVERLAADEAIIHVERTPRVALGVLVLAQVTEAVRHTSS